MPTSFGPVPNTPIRDNPTEDSIWKRWFSQLRAQFSASGLIGSNSVLFSDASGVITADSSFGYDDTTNILTIDNITVADNTILGSAAADTLTINAGAWTIGNTFTWTRAAGTVAAGSVLDQVLTQTFQGNAAGTTDMRSFRFTATGSGANNIANLYTLQGLATFSGAGNITSEIAGGLFSCSVSGGGTAATISGLRSTYAVSSGSIATSGAGVNITTPSTGTGAITTANGVLVNNQGGANIATSIGIKINDFSLSPTAMRGIQSSLSSGTGKANLYIDGTADNLFAGNVRIGSVVAPTVALNVTGNTVVSLSVQANFGFGINSLSSSVSYLCAEVPVGSANANYRGFDVTTTIPSTVTGTYVSYRSIPATAAAAFTVGNVIGFSTDQGTLGAGSAITTQTGVLVNALTLGTTIYGVRSSVASAANRWNIYADGTANNAFSGNVRIGSTTAPTVALDVTGAALISTTLGVTGAVTASAGLVLSGTASNITLGSNFISNGGTDAGLSLNSSNNATLSGTLIVQGANIAVQGTNANIELQGADGSSPQIVLANASGTNHWQIFETLSGGSQNTFTIFDSVAAAARITIATTTGNVTVAQDLAVSGGDITSSATTFNLLNATVTTLNIGGAATTLAMGAGAASSATLAFTTGIALNTAAVTTNQTTLACFNTTATTVNAFGGASTALNIGNASGLATIAGPLRSVGNFDVNTNKFTVTASNGNTLVAGTFNVTGITTLNNKIYPATDAAATQSAAGLYAGTGAPNNANGADGDIYFRSDGGALSTVYQRRAGAWTGVL